MKKIPSQPGASWRKQCASLALVIALVCTLGGTSAFARASSDLEVKPRADKTATESRNDTKKDTGSVTKLRADVLTMVAEVKAGKVSPANSQIQNPKRSNLSKGKKIAIGVGIAAAVVVAVLVVKHKRDHLFDGIRIF